MPTLAKRVKALRNALKLSQTEFAKRIGRKQQTITAWENGERNIPDFACLALVQVFNVNETWLRTGVGEMFVQQSETVEPFTGNKRALAEQYLLEKFRELSPELQNDVLGFCAFLIDENAKHLKKCLDEVADASSESGNVGDVSTP